MAETMEQKLAELERHLFAGLVCEIPQIKRGLVWCKTCGREQKVNGADCLRDGWPKCCGHTMTIDSPQERARGEKK